jgi:prophage regulatory protein
MEKNMKLLRAKQILQIFPISKSTFYKWVKEGKFPKPIKYGTRCSVWEEEVIKSLIDSETK